MEPPKTAEAFLREIIGGFVIQITLLQAEIEQLNATIQGLSTTRPEPPA